MKDCMGCMADGGYYTLQEDEVFVTCDYCGGTGKIDDNDYFQYTLMDIARGFAYLEEGEYRKNRNSDPDGEGYNFIAAESMMSESDYFTMRVYDRYYDNLNRLETMSLEDKQLLVAWYESSSLLAPR
jgi:hypothetical protein